MSEKYNHLLNETEPSIEKEFIDFLVENSEIECPEVNVDDAWSNLQEQITPEKKSFSWMKIAAAIAFIAVASVVYIQLSSPDLQTVASNDEEASVKLSDGSVAVLNENSKFTFPNTFGDQRLVSFSGEGYFDISKSKKPFIIDAGQVKVKVLGTAFNLVTGEDKIHLFVDRGLVAFVKDGVETKVKAGSEAIFNTSDNSVTFTESPSPNIMSWRNGHFEFKDTPLNDVLSELEEFYNVSFKLNNEKIGTCKVTATFEKAPLKKVLEVFSSILQVTTERKGDTIKIAGEGC